MPEPGYFFLIYLSTHGPLPSFFFFFNYYFLMLCAQEFRFLQRKSLPMPSLSFKILLFLNQFLHSYCRKHPQHWQDSKIFTWVFKAQPGLWEHPYCEYLREQGTPVVLSTMSALTEALEWLSPYWRRSEHPSERGPHSTGAVWRRSSTSAETRPPTTVFWSVHNLRRV